MAAHGKAKKEEEDEGPPSVALLDMYANAAETYRSISLQRGNPAMLSYPNAFGFTVPHNPYAAAPGAYAYPYAYGFPHPQGAMGPPPQQPFGPGHQQQHYGGYTGFFAESGGPGYQGPGPASYSGGLHIVHHAAAMHPVSTTASTTPIVLRRKKKKGLVITDVFGNSIGDERFKPAAYFQKWLAYYVSTIVSRRSTRAR